MFDVLILVFQTIGNVQFVIEYHYHFLWGLPSGLFHSVISQASKIESQFHFIHCR